MRYLLIFMLLVAIFVVGKRSCTFTSFNAIQGEGNLKTETRNVAGFHKIDLEMSGNVVFTTGDFQVSVEAEENLLQYIKTENQNGTLRIYSDKNISTSKDLIFKVSAPSLDGLSLAGSGSMEVKSPLESDKMDISLGGSGEISVPQATFNSLECEIGGSGNVKLGGKANSARVSLSGSGDVQAKDMEINELRAGIAGSGSVSANVTQVLKADISGSGEVVYSGSPAVESNISGSGSVHKQ